MKPLAYITCISTAALAILTGIYIFYTHKIADVAEKALLIDTSPKVFLQDIDFKRSLNRSEKKINVSAVLKITNVGKTEAREFKCTYTMSSGKVRIEDELKPMPYIFPTQRLEYNTKIFSVSLSEEEFSAAEEAMEKKIPYLPEKQIEVLLNLNLQYVDNDGKQRDVPYKIGYSFNNNQMEFMLQ